MRKFSYLLTFFILTPLTIALSSFSLLTLRSTLSPTQKVLAANSSSLIDSPQFGVQVYAALPTEQPLVSTSPISADARSEIIRQYLQNYSSPLEPFAPLLIQIADQYGLDYRLLIAIAQQESNLCKKAPPFTYNCWGWGIHSRGTLGFSDFETAIQTVAKGIKEDYVDQGYDTVEKMMLKYTPLSNGSWAFGVNQFLSEME